MKIELSRHARQELQRRSVPIKLLESVLNNPRQIIQQPDGKKVYQSQLDFGDGKILLLRAIVVELNELNLMTTVSRTRKISKYWRMP